MNTVTWLWHHQEWETTQLGPFSSKIKDRVAVRVHRPANQSTAAVASR